MARIPEKDFWTTEYKSTALLARLGAAERSIMNANEPTANINMAIPKPNGR
ncbi:hypothetical protein ACFRFQ_30200 [Rhodococcus sp. NPDC056743]|uniref:hypothetical protein n=1 Tax=Rhodococcus sp. NPDC056743 TaxID=3345934 RepID=UPI00366E9431